jgi:hypothetical protein
MDYLQLHRRGAHPRMGTLAVFWVIFAAVFSRQIAVAQVHFQVSGEGSSAVDLIPPENLSPGWTGGSSVQSGDLVLQGNPAIPNISSLTPAEYEALAQSQLDAAVPLPFSYRVRNSQWSQVAAGQYGLGMFSFVDTGYLESHETSGLNFGMGVHLLKGPMQPDLHPRLWDFSMGYQRRGELAWGIEYDAAFNVGIFSDFEDSAREGVRFPSHAALSGDITPRLQWVLGADYLDREDYAVLPIAGLRWQPTDQLYLNIEVPNPEFGYRYSETGMAYIRGALGGGTWDIEYVDAGDDVMTYRQWELLFGIANRTADRATGIEVGYLIDRALEFRDSGQALNLPDAWFFRIVTRY